MRKILVFGDEDRSLLHGMVPDRGVVGVPQADVGDVFGLVVLYKGTDTLMVLYKGTDTLMCFGVSSYSALIKGKGFILLFPPEWKPLLVASAACLGFVALATGCRLLARHAFKIRAPRLEP